MKNQTIYENNKKVCVYIKLHEVFAAESDYKEWCFLVYNIIMQLQSEQNFLKKNFWNSKKRISASLRHNNSSNMVIYNGHNKYEPSFGNGKLSFCATNQLKVQCNSF